MVRGEGSVMPDASWDTIMAAVRAETKALIGGGGCIFIYSRSARRISFEINGNDN